VSPPSVEPASVPHAMNVTGVGELSLEWAIGVFVTLGALRLGLAGALVVCQGGLDATWAWIGSLPLILRPAAWLLIVPIAAAVCFG
jgi:hypothetical protein